MFSSTGNRRKHEKQIHGLHQNGTIRSLAEANTVNKIQGRLVSILTLSEMLHSKTNTFMSLKSSSSYNTIKLPITHKQIGPETPLKGKLFMVHIYNFWNVTELTPAKIFGVICKRSLHFQGNLYFSCFTDLLLVKRTKSPKMKRNPRKYLAPLIISFLVR